MAETELPTYEAACRCPKCGKPGEVRLKEAAPREAKLPPGTELHTVYCVTELCRWHETSWFVQVNKDGSIPPPRNHTGEKKLYAKFEGHDQMARDVMRALQDQYDASTQEGGAEIKSPFQR